MDSLKNTVFFKSLVLVIMYCCKTRPGNSHQVLMMLLQAVDLITCGRPAEQLNVQYLPCYLYAGGLWDQLAKNCTPGRTNKTQDLFTFGLREKDSAKKRLKDKNMPYALY